MTIKNKLNRIERIKQKKKQKKKKKEKMLNTKKMVRLQQRNR